MDTQDKAHESGRLAVEKKAKDVILLDLSDLTDIADIFVIASGTSERHVKTISDSIEKGMKEEGVKPLSVEGNEEGRWVIMDYGDVIVHVFLESLRELYDLESLWIEARRQVVE